jgi:predicted O-methyltransferase YrrM
VRGTAAAAPSPTLGEIVGALVGVLQQEGALPTGRGEVPWEAFGRLSSRVHAEFHVPGTTVTAVMTRLLFALGFLARPRAVLGAGTYVGYAFAWLVRDRDDPAAAPYCTSAVAVDTDATATDLARGNLGKLGHGAALRVVTADAHEVLRNRREPLDLLYLDVDDPTSGKAAYASLLRAAEPALAPGALVLAHDPCVPKFTDDFQAYHDAVVESPRLSGPWVVPVDFCGLSVARVGDEPEGP